LKIAFKGSLRRFISLGDGYIPRWHIKRRDGAIFGVSRPYFLYTVLLSFKKRKIKKKVVVTPSGGLGGFFQFFSL